MIFAHSFRTFREESGVSLSSSKDQGGVVPVRGPGGAFGGYDFRNDRLKPLEIGFTEFFVDHDRVAHQYPGRSLPDAIRIRQILTPNENSSGFKNPNDILHAK